MARLLRWALIAGGLGGLGWLVARLLRSPGPAPAPGATAPVAPAAPVVAPVVAEPVAEAVPAPEPPSEPAPAPEPATVTTPSDAPAAKASATGVGTLDPWLAPEGEACPATHPIKAKEASGIYHVPGGLSYERTVADRCYASEEAAQADGYRKAKR